MAKIHNSNRRAEASDALTLANAPSSAAGKGPTTASLAGATPVQAKAADNAVPQQENRGAADQITAQDVMYELIAHKMGYQDNIGTTEGQLLQSWGYEPNWASKINDAATGLFVGLIVPQTGRSDLNAIVVFRGTEPTNGIDDIVADINPVSVGNNQFRANQRFIGQLIAEGGGKVNVTGHSLGGALAQLCAAAFTGSVNEVYTYQSPGIDSSSAEAFDETEDHPTVRHHMAGGDLVDNAGDKHLEGTHFLHTPGGGPASHVRYLMTSPELAEQRRQAGVTDEVLAQLGIDKRDNKKPIEQFDKYPSPVMNAVSETVRAGAGLVLYPILNGVNVLTRNDDKALREQISGADAAALGSLPISERSYMLDRLCRGSTGNKDEEAILKVLRASVSAGDVVPIIDLAGPHLLAKNLHGGQWDQLKALFQQHYYTQCSQDSAFDLIQKCISGRTSEWEEEMIADLLVMRGDGRQLITRIGGGNFASGLNTVQWQLDGGDQRRVDAIFDQ